MATEIPVCEFPMMSEPGTVTSATQVPVKHAGGGAANCAPATPLIPGRTTTYALMMPGPESERLQSEPVASV